MLVRVKHNELNDFANTMDNNADDIALEIENMLQKLEELKSIWQGQDFNIFEEKLHNYLNHMKLIPYTLNVFGEFTRRADKMYSESDRQFAKKIEQEVNYDE